MFTIIISVFCRKEEKPVQENSILFVKEGEIVRKKI